MMTRYPVALLALLLVVFSAPIPAQQPADSQASTKPRRPRIALVLEGGAALGLAHIGVLRYLEEHRIPVSLVTGTSMGGLVGGLYATGRSPAEIQSLVDSVNWPQVLSGRTPYQELSFRRRQDERDYPNRLGFGLRGGSVRLPEGLNSGHDVGLIFDRVALPYSQLQSFDELPIPLACVATDLVSNKEYVFRKGSLSLALRSTMSIPGAFYPVRTDGHVFVDGGLLNNLPTDVAKEMGADLIIAVHLQVASLDPKASLSAVGVLSRSVSVTIAANELRSMQQADVLISVPLPDFGSTDYAKAAAIIQRGYEAAQSKAALLSTFSVDEVEWEARRAEINSRRRDVPVPQFVKVEGTTPKLADEVRHEISSNVGKPVDTALLEQQLTAVRAVGRYSSLGYRMIESNGSTGLLVVASEKSYSPPSVLPLLQVDTSDTSTQFTLGARITFLDIGGFGSDWRTDVAIGSDREFSSEYYRPIADSRFFIAPQAFAFDRQTNLFVADERVAEYRHRQYGGAFDIGIALDRRSEFRLGYRIAEQRFDREVGVSLLPSVSGILGETRFRYAFLGTDDPVIPKQGVNALFRAAWVDSAPGAAGGFPLVETRLGMHHKIGDASSLYLIASGGSTFGRDQTGIPVFSLGGHQDLMAYDKNEILANQYYLFRAGYLHRIARIPSTLGDAVYLTGGLDAGEVFAINGNHVPADGYVGLLANTIFGPVAVAASIGDRGHHKLVFAVGRFF